MLLKTHFNENGKYGKEKDDGKWGIDPRQQPHPQVGGEFLKKSCRSAETKF